MKTKKKNSIGKRILSSVLAFATALSGFTFTPITSNTVEAATATTTYLGHDVANNALKYLGYGYSQSSRYGTNGTFDCSGLVYTAMTESDYSNVPTTTDDWISQITNQTLSLTYSGEKGDFYGVKYASSLTDYNNWVNNNTYPGYAIVLAVATSTDTIKSSAALTPGTVIVTDGSNGSDQHAMIYLGDVTQPSFTSGDGASYWKAYYNYLADVLTTLSGTYSNIDISTSAVRLCAYSSQSAYNTTGYTIIDWDSSISGKALYSSKQDYYLILNGGGADGSTTLGFSGWIVDAASTDVGVRLTNTIGGKNGNSTNAYVISFPSTTKYYATVGLQKVKSSSDLTTVVSGATYAMSESLSTLQSLASSTYSSASDAKSKANAKSGVTAITTTSNSVTYFDTQSWDSSEGETKTYYIMELYAPTGYEKETGYYTITVTGTTDSDGLAASITSSSSSTSSFVKRSNSTSGSYITVVEEWNYYAAMDLVKFDSEDADEAVANAIYVLIDATNASSFESSLTSWAATANSKSSKEAAILSFYNSMGSYSSAMVGVYRSHSDGSLSALKSFSTTTGTIDEDDSLTLNFGQTTTKQYIIMEIYSPSGYSLDTNYYTFTLNSNGNMDSSRSVALRKSTISGFTSSSGSSGRISINGNTSSSNTSIDTNKLYLEFNDVHLLYSKLGIVKVNSESTSTKVSGAVYVISDDLNTVNAAYILAATYSDASEFVSDVNSMYDSNTLQAVETSSSGAVYFPVALSWNPEEDGTTKTFYVKEVINADNYNLETGYYVVKVKGTTDSDGVASTITSITPTNISGSSYYKIVSGSDGEYAELANTPSNYYGRFMVQKVVEYADGTVEDVAVSGIKFGVYSDSSCESSTLVKTITTNANGIATYSFSASSNSTETYYVKEISLPSSLSGLTVSSDVYKVEVTPSDVSGYESTIKVWKGSTSVSTTSSTVGYSFDYPNTQQTLYGGFAVQKVDDTGTAVTSNASGIVFYVYSDSSCDSEYLVATLTTNSSGRTDSYTDDWDLEIDGSNTTATYYVKEDATASATALARLNMEADTDVIEVVVTGSTSSASASTIKEANDLTDSSKTVTYSNSTSTISYINYGNSQLINVSATKKFEDDADDRITSVTFKLTQNGNDMDKTVTLTSSNASSGNWVNSTAFTGLSKYDSSGNAYTYALKETVVVYNDYWGTSHTVNTESIIKKLFGATVSGNTTITNTFNYTTYTVNKEFEDDTESLVSSIQVTLYATYAGTTKTVGTKTLTKSSGWTATWEGLDEYDYEGNLVKYYTEEVTVKYTDLDGNSLTATGNTVISTLFGDLTVTSSATGATITGTLTNDYETVSHTATKAFGTDTSGRINYVKVRVYRSTDGKTYTATNWTKTLNSSNNWSYTFEELDKYDSNGNKYIYTVEEYEVSYNDMYGTSHVIDSSSVIETIFEPTTKESSNGLTTTITNTIQTTTLPVEKRFSDNAGSFIDEVVFRLYDNGTAKSGWTVTVNKSTSWEGTFTGLDKYDYTGTLKTYTSKEYQVTYTNASGVTKTLTGTSAIEEYFKITESTSGSTNVTTNAPIRLYGGITVEKVNAEKETVKIEGVQYGVYSDASCENLIEYIYTDANGIATYEVDQTSTDWFKLNSLTKTVYVKEVHTVEPYVLDETIYTVVITGSEVDAEHSTCSVTANSKNIGTKITQFTQENEEQYGQITVYKYGEVLTGFTEATLSGDGTIVTGYTNGLFTYEYKLSAGAGATFKLYAAEDISNEAGTINYKKDQLIETLTTGSDGTLTFGLPTSDHPYGILPMGTYYIVETEAPEGQTIPVTHQWTVTLKYAGETESVSYESLSVYDTLGDAEVSLSKIDGTTKYGLENAYYGLYAASDITNSEGTVIVKAGALISVVKTDSNGEGTFLNKNGKSIDIPYGSYYIQEIQTRDGYIYSDEKFEFDFNAPSRASFANEITSKNHEFKDDRMTAFISIVKQDSVTGAAQGDATLKGAVYGLYAKEDIIHPDGKTGTLYKAGDLVAELTTDVNGYAEIDNLYLGKYYVQEISPSEGYLLDTDTYDLTVVSEGPNNKATAVTVGRNIEVVYDDTTVYEDVIERPFSLVKLTAEDEDDTEFYGVDGAGFTVYLVSTLVYNNDGSINYDASPKTVINADGSTEGFTYTTYTTEGTVDKVGYYESIDIPYGTYIVHESTVPANTKQVSDFYVYITNADTYKNSLSIPIANIEVTQTTRYFFDAPFNAKIKIIKKDAQTGEEVILSNATFKIYDVDNEEYLGYYKLDDNSKKVWVETWTTNDEGFVITEEAFKVGTYRIEEITAPESFYNKEVAENWTSTFTIDIDTGLTFEGRDVSDYYDADLKCYILPVVYTDDEVRGTIEVTKSGEVLDSYDTTTGTFGYVTTGLPGAVYTVYAAEDIYTPDGQLDEYGNRKTYFLKDEEVGTIITDDSGCGSLENLPLGNYYIVETRAPEGYLISDEVQYATLEYAGQTVKTVFDTDGTENSFYNTRPTYDISIVKYERYEDGTTNYDTVLAGTGFSLITTTDIVNYWGEVIVNAGTVLANVVTGEDGRATIPAEIDLPFGAYQFVETSVPAGYVLDTTPVTAVYGYQGQDTPVITVACEQANHYIKVEISKEDIETGDAVVGAELAIYSVAEDGTETLYDTWVSDGTAYRINRIPAGTYIIRELSAPGYYVCADDITIVVEAVAEVQGYTMYDDFTKIQIDKVDEETGEPVVGATLELYVKNADGSRGELIDSWTSDGTGHYIERLNKGDYILVETSAPDVYVCAEDMIITVIDTPDVQYFEMADPVTKVDISKTDITTGEEIEGAVLTVYKKNDDGTKGEKVSSWTTDGTPHRIERLTHGDYILVEEYAPGCYVTSQEVEFTVTDENIIVQVEMVDDFTKAEIAKVDIETGEYVVGAEMELYKAKDDGTKGELVASWTTTSEPYYIERLDKGTYIVHEVSAPGSYVTAEDITIEIVDTPDVQTFTMDDDYTKIQILKVDIETGEPVVGAVIEMYKVNSDGTRGEFVDTWTSDGTAHYMERVDKGDYILVETYAPGYYVSGEFTFTVEDTPEVQTFTMTDDFTKVAIEKVDIETGEPVIGAVLSLYVLNDDGTKGDRIDTWVVEEEPYYIERLDKGNYILVENLAPGYYVTSEDMIITVGDTPEVQTFTMEDDVTKLQITKTDIVTGEEVIGAILSIYERNADGSRGDLVVTWTSTEEPYYIDRLDKGTYILVEEYAPDQYITAKDITFIVDDTGEIQVVEMEDDVTKVLISKTDIVTDAEVAGATLSIYSVDDNGERTLIETWESTTRPHYIEGLNKGNYVLVEEYAPTCYVTAQEVEFTVTDTAEIQTVVMVDDFTKAEILKVDAETGEPVVGAVIEMYKVNSDGTKGELVDKWTTDGTAHYIERLDKGDYILVETYAPGSYVSGEMTITVVDTDEVQSFTMKDDFTKVEISKTDIVTGEEVEGATLTIYSVDENGNRTKVETWTSTDEPHYIERLDKGDYVLVEEYAPGSYVTANEVEFTVEDTGEIQTVEMVDDFTKVEISKTDIVTGEEVEGATLTIYSVDENGNRTKVETWTSTDEPHYIERLDKGDYVLVEEYAPGSYVTANEVEFTVEDTGEIQTVEMVDDFTKVEISKTDLVDGKPVEGATLTLYKVEDDGTRTLIETWVTDGEPHTIERLDKGTYVLVEENTPNGYQVAEEVTFEVTDTGEVQKVEMFDDRTYGKVIVNKTDDDGNPIEGVEFTITNKDTGEIVAVLVTDENGYAESDLLPIDERAEDQTLTPITYVIKETAAPDYYVIDDTETEFTFEYVDDTTPVVEVEFSIINKLMYGILEIHKVDQNGDPLGAGVEFLVTCVDTGETWTLVTDENGYAYIDKLLVGEYVDGVWTYYTYTLQETKTLDNYKLDDTVYTWQFSADNTTAEALYQSFTVKNVILGIKDMSKAGGVGMLMLAVAFVLMAVKKKKDEDDEEGEIA